MKHEQSKILKAYADNKDLCILTLDAGKWIHTSPKAIFDYPFSEFFACLPKHKNECLHWLNGGEVEIMEHKFKVHDAFFADYTIDKELQPWNESLEWMSSCHSFRIKPKKVKRWIGVYGIFSTPMLFDSRDDCEEYVKSRATSGTLPESLSAVQYIEIEVDKIVLKRRG